MRETVLWEVVMYERPNNGLFDGAARNLQKVTWDCVKVCVFECVCV